LIKIETRVEEINKLKSENQLLIEKKQMNQKKHEDLVTAKGTHWLFLLYFFLFNFFLYMKKVEGILIRKF